MDAAKRTPGRAFCPKCGQKYAVPEEELKRHPGLRFRATCRQCDTPFSVRWTDAGMITDTDELERADDVGRGRNVLPKGSRVGKYEVEDMIASGGSASIYRAFEMGANRTVALKVLHREADSDYGVRFRREVEVQGNLKHPNLMPIFDQGAVDGKPYYTMELLHKPTTLETIVGLFRSGRLAYNPALRTLDSMEALLRQVLLPVTRAIDFANSNGIVHRDLKPGNVILDARTLHVYVIDFGICHVSGQTGQRLVLRAKGAAAPEAQKRLTMGTVRFMPPEQARGEFSDHGDVWALGALLYYMLVGDSPIAPAIDLRRVGIDKRIANLRKIAESSRAAGDHEEAEFYEQRVEQLKSGTARTTRDVLKDAQNANYRPPPDGTNPALAAVAARGMAANPDDRYPTGGAFASDITRYIEGRPVRAYVASLSPGRAALYRTRLHFQRNRTPVLVGGVALVLAVLVVIFLLFRAGVDRREQVDAWVAEARASSNPALQEDRLTKALALQPDHQESKRLLALARKYVPIREKLKNARKVKSKVQRLRKARQFDEAGRLAEDMAAVLEGSVLPDLESLPESYPGRSDEKEARKLADFLRGRRLVRVVSVPARVSVGLIPHRSRSNPKLLWDKRRDWGIAPLDLSTHALEPGSYVIVFTRGDKAIHHPFVITHTTKAGGRVSCAMDPGNLPDGMLYIRGVKRMHYGDLRFRERTERVDLDAFLLDAYEVTNAQYAAYLNTLDSQRRPMAAPRRLLPGPGDNTDPLWTEQADGTWKCPEGTANEPVTSISYLDAAAYASWADKRLPTPQEWELAARGLDGRDYPFGNDLNPETCNAHTGSVAPITAFLLDRSPFGVYHMGGNVAEWTDARGGDKAMVKGGSFDLPRYRVIVSSFGRRRADLPYPDVGFRCAKSVSESR